MNAEAVASAETNDATPATPSSNEQVVEAAAVALGWNPNHKGSDDKPFKSAAEFLEESKYRLPLIIKQRDRLASEVAALKADQEATNAQVRGALEIIKKDKDEELQQAIDALNEQWAQAVADQDVEKIKDLGKKLRKAEREVAKADAEEATPSAKPAAKTDQEVPKQPQYAVEWRERNAWYGDGSDPVHRRATRMALALGVDFEQEEGLTGKALLDRVEEEMRVRMPELFGNERESPRVEPSTRGGGVRRVKYRAEDIPSEIVRAFVGKGKAFKTAQEYADYMNRKKE